MKKEITYPCIVYVEAALMENGEVIHLGKTIGRIGEKQRELLEAGATKTARGNEPVVALGNGNVA